MVVLVVAVLALRHPTSKTTGTASNSPSHTASTSTPVKHSTSAPAHSSSHAATTSAAAKPKALPLIVLNTTSTSHLAADAASLFTQAGWKVTSYANYQNNILSTCAYYDPNVSGAKAAATLLQTEFPSILRVKEKFSGLPSGPIVVVLTSNFKTA